MDQMKEQNKTREKELNKIETANLSDTKFKTLVIRMLKELIDYGNNIKEEMKVTLNEIKKNLHGTNSEGEETGVQMNNLDHKEEISIQPEQQEIRIQNNKNSIRHLWDISKHTNIWITGMPEGGEEEQEIENLFEKIMEESSPDLVKVIDIQVQETERESLKQVVPKKDHIKTHHN